MAIFHSVLIGFVGFSFLYYGISCLSSNVMMAEFARFGLSDLQRQLTGVLQILGGLGAIIGFFYKPLQILSMIGISVLMLLGWGVRLKIEDPFLESLPSFLFFILCAYLSFYLIKN